jgi:site-specific DNA recombinase
VVPALTLTSVFPSTLMSPSHANKKGVRYRYYISQAVLLSRKDKAGGIARVAAPDIE